LSLPFLKPFDCRRFFCHRREFTMDHRRFVLSSTAGIIGSALSRTLEASRQRLGPKASAEERGWFFPAQNLSKLAGY
jgi:hypothetical protein